MVLAKTVDFQPLHSQVSSVDIFLLLLLSVYQPAHLIISSAHTDRLHRFVWYTYFVSLFFVFFFPQIDLFIFLYFAFLDKPQNPVVGDRKQVRERRRSRT